MAPCLHTAPTSTIPCYFVSFKNLQSFHFVCTGFWKDGWTLQCFLLVSTMLVWATTLSVVFNQVEMVQVGKLHVCLWYMMLLLLSNEFSNPPGTIKFYVTYMYINWDCLVRSMVVTIWLWWLSVINYYNIVLCVHL